MSGNATLPGGASSSSQDENPTRAEELLAFVKEHPTEVGQVLDALEVERHDNPQFILELVAAVAGGPRAWARFALRHPRLVATVADIVKDIPEVQQAVAEFL